MIPDLPLVFAFTVAIGLICPLDLFADDRQSNSFLTGIKFRQELEQPFSANSTLSELRPILTQVASSRRVSIVLDRRLNPSAEFPFEIKNVPLRTGLAQIAQLVNGETTYTENTVFLGPHPATSRLRTLIELRRLELTSKESAIPERRRTELQRRRTIEWQDLDTPREILDAVAKPFQLNFSNPEVIPHDLWAAASLPDVSLTEALSLVLIQFDLTFRWTNLGTSVEFLPIPDRISLERKIRPKQKLADAMALIHDRFPELDAKISNSEIVVHGLFEDHERVSHLLRGETPSRPRTANLPQDLKQQKFTFRTEFPVPTIALMKKLEESDIRFEYDDDELKAAGIDLEQTVQIDLKTVSADDLFHTIFDPVKLEFQIDHLTVKLKPKKTSPK